MQPQSIKQTANILLHPNPQLRTHLLINTYACRKREGGRSTYACLKHTHAVHSRKAVQTCSFFCNRATYKYPYADIYISTSNPKQTEGEFFFISYVPVSDLLIFKKRKHICAIYVQTKEERKQK